MTWSFFKPLVPDGHIPTMSIVAFRGLIGNPGCQNVLMKNKLVCAHLGAASFTSTAKPTQQKRGQLPFESLLLAAKTILITESRALRSFELALFQTLKP